MQQVAVQISGVSPLMMHNKRLADPLDPITRAIKELTGKRKKTDDDYEQIAKLEFQGGIYYDKESGIHMPGYNILKTIINAARIERLGTAVSRGVMILESKASFSYNGPRIPPEQLYEYKEFVDYRSVSGQGSKGGSKTMRCRPVFNQWGCTFTMLVDLEIINPQDVRRCIEKAGRYIGLCDGRIMGYGRFEIEAWKESEI